MVAEAYEHIITPQEYLAGERESEIKHEYDDGEIYAMSGASRAHIKITASLMIHIGSQLLGKPCEPMGPDARVKIGPANQYVYPDFTVACQPILYEDGEVDTLLNPKVVIEVLSPSTEGRDRSRKFLGYRQIESLTDYLMISQDRVLVEHYRRQSNDVWTFHDSRQLGDAVELESIGCRLTLAEIYERVEISG